MLSEMVKSAKREILREGMDRFIYIIVNRNVLQEAGNIQHVIDIWIGTDQFKIRGFIGFIRVLVDDFHIVPRGEQDEGALDGPQAGTGENFNFREIEQ